jgi:transcriptional regulator with XRE-family HTH domain
MDRTGLADFLRRRREGLRPADVGLGAGVRRRTPGLRREEVAALAALSVDYYGRLEQARGPHPSVQALTSLARALRLSDDERDHLFHLAGQEAPSRRAGTRHVRPGVLLVLDRLADAAAFVVSDLGETLVQNQLARDLLGDTTHHRGREAYDVWRWFTDPAARALHPASEHDQHSRTRVADLRATAGRRRGDADVEDLVAALLRTSPEFAALWSQHEVAVRRADRKCILHPVVGAVEVDCETLLVADEGQVLILLTARPGTPAQQRLELLRVVGRQDLEPDTRTGARPGSSPA